MYRDILKTGRYICKPALIDIPEFTKAYDWLVARMNLQIGSPRDGVKYPVWAWYAQGSGHKKPDLRRERWSNGSDGKKMVCMELEVPDEQVVLSDFDNWHAILNNI